MTTKLEAGVRKIERTMEDYDGQPPTEFTVGLETEGGIVLAADAPSHTPMDAELPKVSGRSKRFTIFTTYDGELAEEIDVDAVNAKYAKALAEIILAEQYDHRLVIKSVEERFGLYL